MTFTTLDKWIQLRGGAKIKQMALEKESMVRWKILPAFFSSTDLNEQEAIGFSIGFNCFIQPELEDRFKGLEDQSTD